MGHFHLHLLRLFHRHARVGVHQESHYLDKMGELPLDGGETKLQRPNPNLNNL